jgi:DNA-binding NtrC family response regulator
MYKLLYVDNVPATAALEQLVAEAGFGVTECSSAASLRQILQTDIGDFDVAVVDYLLEAPFEPDFQNGIEATKALLSRNPDMGVIGISAYLNSQFSELYGSVIGQWLLAGARWFCDKDALVSGEGFEVTLNVLLQCAARKRELNLLRSQAVSVQLDHYPGLHDTLGTLDRIARLPAPVLILGETGTGKELLARRIHQLSSRRSGPFVVGNCANLRGELAEVMLHGQEIHHNDPRARGYPKPGWFEQADGGTLFLDEIGDLPVDAQASLLRVLQERHVRRILGDDWVPVDFRLVAATNRDLDADVASKAFRRDLYFRLCAFPVKVPPLRQRRSDIPRIIDHFRAKYNSAFARAVVFDKETVSSLGKRDYPGNIRELENLIQRFIALAESDAPTWEELRSLDAPLITPQEDNESMPTIASQSQYAENLTKWMEAHIGEMGRSPDYRSRTAFIRGAVKHVSESFNVPPEYPKTEQYILNELVKKLKPQLYRQIVEAGLKAKPKRSKDLGK